MTYPLNTTLIFTSLTQASAAADLWGDMEIDSYILGADGICWYSYFDPLAEKWRIVLDTEEKCGWFVPQAGDTGYAFDSEGEQKHGEFRGGDIIKNTMMLFNSPSHMISFLMFSDIPAPVIEKRNGKPFPTPQEVILPEETL